MHVRKSFAYNTNKRSDVVITMELDELVFEWIVWHQAVEYIKQDLPKVESANLRFPFLAGGILRQLGNNVYRKEQEVAKELRSSGIKIIKEKLDRGELFVVWSHQGMTDILRIHEGKLRTEVQKKVDGLINTFLEGWKK